MIADEQALSKKLKCLESWRWKLRTRWSLRIFPTRGRRTDCEVEVGQDDIPVIGEKTAVLKPKSIFNADESGFMYHLAPYTTVATTKMLGNDKAN